MAKVIEKKAPKEKKAETPKVVKAVTKESSFEDKVKKHEEFLAAKRALKTEISTKAEPINGADASVPEAKFKALQAEERKWLESIAKMLDTEIKKNGFMYRLVKRGEKTLIYSQHPIEDGVVNDKPCAFEVFSSKISPPKIAFKKPYEAYEMFPGNGVFGIWAFACGDMERAEVRFKELETGITETEDSEDSDDDSDE